MKFGMSARGDQVDDDVLMLVAAALADPAHAVRAHQREAFGQHPRRRVKIAEPLDPIGGEAGLLLELLDRGVFDRRIRILVADQAGGKLEAAAPSATRGWSTRITLPSCSARMTTARSRRRGSTYSQLPRRMARRYLPCPHDLGGGSRRGSQLDQLVRDFVGVGRRAREMLGEHRADLLDRGDDAVADAALASPRPAAPPSPRPRSPASVTFSDRLVGDDLGAPLGHRQIDEDPGAPDRAPLGRGLEDGDRPAPNPAVLGRARRQRQPQRHPFQDQQRGGELEHREHHQQGQQLASVGSGCQPPISRSYHQISQSGRHAAQASTANSSTHRPVQRDIVIGIADRRRDRDDLAVAVRFRRGDRRADLGVVGFGELGITMLPMLRRRRTSRRRRRSRHRRRPSRRRPSPIRRPSRRRANRG